MFKYKSFPIKETKEKCMDITIFIKVVALVERYRKEKTGYIISVCEIESDANICGEIK